MILLDETFPTMGVKARLLAEYPDAFGEDRAREQLARARQCIETLAAQLTRFDPASELSALNDDPAPSRRVSVALGSAVQSAVWAAERTGGLVDPTMVQALIDGGYATSRAGMKPADLDAALADAPPRAPASPSPDAAWRSIGVSDDFQTVTRPPGLLIDLGGVGKGLAADAAARVLTGADRFVVDCGGDLAVGGATVDRRPWDLDIRDPRTGGTAQTIRMGTGGIATSGLDVRLWRTEDGRPFHHLLDPSTAEPAWTGLIAATAIAPSAMEAEADAKAAFLSGPVAAERLLARGGGAIAPESGPLRLIGVRPAPPVVRLRPTPRHEPRKSPA